MSRMLVVLVMLCWVNAGVSFVVAQDPASNVEVEEVLLRAKDGFSISASFYKGKDDVGKGKEAAAIIMLHDIDRNRADYNDLASYFAGNGHCVIVPDLRGHGKSKTDPAGNEFAPSRFQKEHLVQMQMDIEACKKFLIQKNDEEVCNIEFLMLVTDGATCLPALGWSILDWSFLPTSTKNGQDVKGLVMLNPVRNYRGLSINDALRTPLISGKAAPNPLDIMIIVGNMKEQVRDAKGLYSSISNSRGKRKDAEDDLEADDIFLREVNSSALHKEFFERNPETVPEFIFDLLEFRILKNTAYGWKMRKPNP